MATSQPACKREEERILRRADFDAAATRADGAYCARRKTTRRRAAARPGSERLHENARDAQSLSSSVKPAVKPGPSELTSARLPRRARGRAPARTSPWPPTYCRSRAALRAIRPRRVRLELRTRPRVHRGPWRRRGDRRMRRCRPAAGRALAKSRPRLREAWWSRAPGYRARRSL